MNKHHLKFILIALLIICNSFKSNAIGVIDTIYTIYQGGQFSPISGTGTIVSLSDEQMSDSLPIGFTFKFFGKEYTSFFISSNGFITFSNNGDAGCCSGQFLPNVNTPNNLIAFAWEDLVPDAGGSINYFTTGNAPERKLVVNFINVPHYGSSNSVTSQVILNEGSNIIEIHTQNMSSDGGKHTMGIENEDGTLAYAVPGRNSSSWSITNDYVSFVPFKMGVNDAGISSINLLKSFCASSQPIIITVKNFGINIIDSVTINWKINGIIQPSIYSNIHLDSLTGAHPTAEVYLGTKLFLQNESDTIVAWTSFPNGIADSVNYNDTLYSVIQPAFPKGIYTIGGLNPDFQTFTQAVSKLTKNGICGSVVFKVRNGTYNEQILIPKIKGASENTTVTFESESGDSTAVILSYSSADYNTNYTVFLDSAKYTIFNKLTIKALNHDLGRAVFIKTGSEHNTFSNCILQGIQNPYSYYSEVVYSNFDNGGIVGCYNKFTNNRILYGSYGIYYISNGSSLEKGTVIENNIFENQSYAALYFYNHDSLLIIHNTIKTNASNSDYYGIYCSGCNNLMLIENNKLYIPNGGYGIYLDNCIGTISKQGLIANNFICTGISNWAYGIYSSNSTFLKLYNNNINIGNNYGIPLNIYNDGDGNIDVRNNILANTGGGYAYFIGSPSSIAISDNNDLFTTGSILAFWSDDQATLENLQTISNQEAHSISQNPLFYSSTNLHVRNPKLDKAGIPLPEIIDDIDNELRDPSTPDIGADEFTPLNVDASISSLINPKMYFPGGLNNINVILKNFGLDTLKNVTIDWNVNGIKQPGFSWSGSLGFNDSVLVKIGSFLFVVNTEYTIKCWSSLPNGLIDTKNGNDTIQVSDLYPSLGGTYTIGGSNPDFPSFQAAIAALIQSSVADSVIFKVRNGTYNEQLSIPQISGVSQNNAITFESESGDSTQVILSYSGTSEKNYTIQLNGSDYITFRKMTIASLDNNYSKVIDIVNGSDFNTFESIIFQGAVVQNTSSGSALVVSESSYDVHNNFVNNKFINGSFGLCFSSSEKVKGTIVKNNIFENQYYHAIYLYNQDSAIICHNIISSNAANSNFYAINCSYCGDEIKIEKNKIYLPNGGYGIWFYACQGTSFNQDLISNNFVQVGGSGSSYGIYSIYSSFVKIYNNNINITGTSTNDGRALCVYSYYSDQYSISIFNNILNNSGGGYAFYTSEPELINSCDYNDLFTTGSNLAYWSENRATLKDLQLASGKDIHSVSINPLFISSINLHVRSVFLDGAAIPLTEIKDDIDGEIRDTLHPDIGADEFNPAKNDAGLLTFESPKIPFYGKNKEVVVALKNYGSDTLKTVFINWAINGIPQRQVQWTGSLAYKDTAFVTLDNFNFDLGSTYVIKTWTSLPNGIADSINYNDTIQSASLHSSLAGIYTIGGANPDFQNFQPAVNALIIGGIADSVVFNVRNGTYAEQISIPEISGSSAKRPVIFQSETGDSTQVILSAFGTSANNYTIQLNGADNFIFKKMTIAAQDKNYARTISIINNSNYNRFESNLLRGITTQSTSNVFSIIYSENNGINNYNSFINNRFENGSFGIFYSSGYTQKGVVVKNNTFVNQYVNGTYFRTFDSLLIQRNTVISNSALTEYAGISFDYCNNYLVIEKNKIMSPRGYGIRLYSCYASSTTQGIISNNFVTVSGSSKAFGIFATYYCNYLNFYFNNVKITSTSTTNNSDIFIDSNCGNMSIQNNILTNTTGYAIYSYSYISFSDYNDLLTKGSYLIHYNSVDYTNLNLWRSESNFDTHSFSIDPFFYSNTDLHVREVLLKKAGAPISLITDDIDGEIRDINNPDIGADEFVLTARNDAGIVFINSPKSPFDQTNHNINVSLLNYGSDTLKNVTINWSVNNVLQTPYNWTGSLKSAASDSFNIGSYAFAPYTSYAIKVWSVNPNGVKDTFNYNDTAIINNFYTALNGAYTIGGYAPDFNTFNLAVNALKLGGVSGPVIFNIRPGIYNEQISIPSIAGTSERNTVTFQSENDDSTLVVLSYNSTNSNNYIIQLSGADYFIFKKLTITSLNNYYNITVYLQNSSSHNSFNNNIIKSFNSNSSNIYSVSSNNNYNSFRNNRVENGYYSFEMRGVSQSDPMLGTIIENNQIINSKYAAFILTNQKNITVSGNLINTNSTYVFFYGIQLSNCTDSISIMKNRIIYSYSGYGISLSNCNGSSANTGIVANNFIQMGGSSYSCYGIYLSNANYQNICFNSINVTSSNSYSEPLRVDYNCSNINLVNNIFVNTGGGYSVDIENTYSIITSDYNDFYVTGGILGYGNGYQAHLSDWKAATGFDAHSYEADPLFYAPDNLHVLQPLLNNNGIPFGSISDDIDNEMRNPNHPDIGADEFDYHDNDISVRELLSLVSGCSLSSSPVTIRVANYGGFPQKGFNVAYSINNSEPVIEIIDTNIIINPGKTIDYTFTKQIDISQWGTYTIKAYTLLPNDEKISNDTLTKSITNYSIPGMVGNMLPLDGETGLSNNVTFSWSPATDAVKYDLYIWQYGNSKPTSPTVTNISQITCTYNSLNYGTKYNWQVYSKTNQCQNPGPIQVFTVRELPDLIVTSVQAPASSYSGQVITVNWVVKNAGTGSTGSQQWIDAVYLSTDATLEKNIDTYLGGVGNLSALNPGQSYSQSSTFTLPDGISGNYYVIVSSNGYNSLVEANDQNNTGNYKFPVTLTPPPDLKVTSIITPSIGTVYSGQTINVTWTVSNDGTGATAGSKWSDKMYLTKDSIFTGNGTVLGEFLHYGILNPAESYTQTRSVLIPEKMFGRYYIYLKTDVNNEIYEHANENNNTRQSDSITIILTPPPDLVVTTLLVPDSASNNQQITIHWTVENDGGSPTGAYTWYDKIYITSSPEYKPDSVIASSQHLGKINPGEAYSSQIKFAIPKGLIGPYYFYVKTDANDDVFEFNNENNNTLRSDTSVIICTPDMTVSNITLPANGLSGEDITIGWAIDNIGNGNIYTDKWIDRVMISNSSTYNSIAMTELAKTEYYSTIQPGRNIAKQLKVTLPYGLNGTYYIYVFTDLNNSVFESNESNNVNIAGKPIQLTIPPWPDLQIAQVNAPHDTLTAGNYYNITYKVTNKGAADTKHQTWIDSLYISPEPAWNPSSVINLRSFPQNMTLKKDSSYTVSGAVQIPRTLAEGNYYMYAFADALNKVFENTDENNNTGRSGSIFIYKYPPVDLAMTEVFAPDSASSGMPINIQWTVKNVGLASTFSNSWIDAIFLSKDIVLDSSDILVKEWTYTDAVKPGMSYTTSKVTNIPNGIQGKYYLLVVADKEDKNSDRNRSNNFNTVRDNLGKPVPINISLTPSPDLIVSKFSGPAIGTTGQPITVKWTIKNQGVGPTINNTWVERIYLSTDPVIDNNDKILGTYTHTGILQPGASYSDTMVVSLPIDKVGNNILVIKTDNNNIEYEHMAEDNNTAISPIVINLPPPSDLVVSNIAFPDSALAGSSISVTWTDKNIGQNPATGTMKDMVYISSDANWDINDIVFGSYSGTINLAPLGQVNRTITAELPGESVGKYYFIVRTDILDNIYEADNTNNTGISKNLIKINVNDLPLNTWKSNVLANNKPLYYKIEIPDSLTGEALLVQLKGDSVYGKNEFYIRYSDMPTRVIYDYSEDNPSQGNQEIVIPTLKQGTYYLMVYGNTTAGANQNVMLFARKLSFELRSITANKGGNTGKMTVLIQGAKFDSTLLVSLANSSDTITASATSFVNLTRIYATFDLNKKALGMYDLIGLKLNGESDKLVNSFEITEGVKPDLEVNMSSRNEVMKGSTVPIRVEYSNSGNTDLDSVVLEMKSVSISPISFTVDGLKDNQTTLQLPCTELNGPGTILRPGARGSIVVYAKEKLGLAFIIVLPEFK